MALVPRYVAELRPYQAGRNPDEVRRQLGLERVIKLASNENPLGPSPLATEAIQRHLGGLHRYPTGGQNLRRALASRFGMDEKNVIAGSGSEGILSNIIRTFLSDDDESLTTEAAFIGYRVLVRSRGVAYRTVPYRDSHYDLDALADAITERTKIVYLANPNNPTGTIFTRAEFERFYARVPERVLIILDEAYFEYATGNPAYPDSLFYRYDNVITLRTFSKAHGLAGVRVGYGFAHEDLIGHLLKVKLPFEPSTLAEAAAIAALEDDGHVRRAVELNAQTLTCLSTGLWKLGVPFVPSSANFVLVDLGSEEAANSITQSMLEQGVIIRPMHAFDLPAFVRISTGTQEETELCLEALKVAIEREVICNSE